MNTVADTTKTLTYNELLTWRFHWILCDIWEIERDYQNRYSGKYDTKEKIVALGVKVRDMVAKADAIIHQTAIMMDIDYHDEVRNACRELPKYQELLKKFQELAEIVINDFNKFNRLELEQIKEAMRKGY